MHTKQSFLINLGVRASRMIQPLGPSCLGVLVQNLLVPKGSHSFFICVLKLCCILGSTRLRFLLFWPDALVMLRLEAFHGHTFADLWIGFPVFAATSVSLPTPRAETSLGTALTPTVFAAVLDRAWLWPRTGPWRWRGTGCWRWIWKRVRSRGWPGPGTGPRSWCG